MTADMRTFVVGNHNALANALEAAAKIYALLPEDITLAELRVMPGRVTGQLSTWPRDDAYSTSLLMWLAQKPGWSWKCDEPRSSSETDRPYIAIGAVTEMNNVTVEIWSHIGADILPRELHTKAVAA